MRISKLLWYYPEVMAEYCVRYNSKAVPIRKMRDLEKYLGNLTHLQAFLCGLNIRPRGFDLNNEYFCGRVDGTHWFSFNREHLFVHFSMQSIEPEIARIGVLAFLDRLQEMADCSEGELKEDICELIKEVKEIEKL